MLIKFADDTTLEVISVRGGAEHIQGTTRDALTFVVDPGIATIGNLINIFSDKNKTKAIYALDETDETVFNLIGQNYTLYVSASNQMQDTLSFREYSGFDTENVNLVKIAQLTYQEHLLEEILAGR